MNYMWIILFLALPLLGTAYVFTHLYQMLPFSPALKWGILGVLGLCIFAFFANFGLFDIDRWPLPVAAATYQVGSSSLIILMYAILLFLLADLGRLAHVIPSSLFRHSWPGTLLVVGLLLGIFTYAYFHYMDKVRQPIELRTDKPLVKPLKLVMLSDLHVGYLNRADELNRWIDLVNRENPDLILIGGDIIDGHIRPLREEHAAAAFRRLKAPVVACLGNHEYYGGIPEAIDFYREAGITLLRDSVVTIAGLNIIGRDDYSNRRRKPLKALTQGLDKRKYTILLDHQPYHLEEAEREGIDFQFSGHTHRGQMWPASLITDAVYEKSFGPHRKSDTQYYVSSGIGIWGGKFRVGTRSEYVVATLDRH